MCGTIKRNLINKTRKDTQLKFYKVTAVPVRLYGCENWALNRVKKAVPPHAMEAHGGRGGIAPT
jgi:hypothetical protein